MTSAKKRNPPWGYDELVLAMDLYVRRGIPSASDPDVIELSGLLNRLHAEQGTDGQATLRNPNGVYLKLCNFRAKDHPGHGMAHGNHLEHDVWDRFAKDRAGLHQEAVSIRGRRVPLARASRLTREQTAVDGRATLRELIKSLPIPVSHGPTEATPLIMALIREAVELQSHLTTHQASPALPGASSGNAISLGTMLGLLVDLTIALEIGNPSHAREMEKKSDHDSRQSDPAQQLIIFPCGARSSVRHFNRTVRRPVDLTSLALNWDQLSKKLPGNYPFNKARAWGVMPRSSGINETRFRRCNKGDLVIFTGNKKAFAAATIRGTLRSSELARTLWHTDSSGTTWDLVFLLSEPVELDVTYEDLSRALGYKSKYAYPAFSVLSGNATARARKALGPKINRLWA